MDALEQIVSQAQYAVGIFCNPQTANYAMLDFPLPDNLAPALEESGTVFVGVIGLVNGTPRTALTVPLDDATISALREAFTGHVGALFEQMAKQQSSVDWLDALYRLEDPRD